MEQINRIELKGNIGMVKVNEVGGSKVARFSLATNYLYKNKDGEGAVETTWHNIVAWEDSVHCEFEKIQKGAPAHVHGRLRLVKFNGNDGIEKQIYEVLANSVEIGNFKNNQSVH